MKFILYYHSIGSGPMSFSIDALYNQIEFLIKYEYTFALLRDLPSHIGNTNKNVVFLTFDDCFLDNYRNALPVLDQHGIKATFFSTVNYSDRVLWGNPIDGRWYNEFSPTATLPFLFMHNDILKELVLRGHEIGAHTLNHPNLDELNDSEKAREILLSFDMLSSVLNADIRTFAYPRGRFDNKSIDILSSINALGFTTRPGYLSSNMDFQLIPRFAAPSSIYDLKSIIKGNFGKTSLHIKILKKLHSFL